MRARGGAPEVRTAGSPWCRALRAPRVAAQSALGFGGKVVLAWHWIGHDLPFSNGTEALTSVLSQVVELHAEQVGAHLMRNDPTGSWTGAVSGTRITVK